MRSNIAIAALAAALHVMAVAFILQQSSTRAANPDGGAARVLVRLIQPSAEGEERTVSRRESHPIHLATPVRKPQIRESVAAVAPRETASSFVAIPASASMARTVPVAESLTPAAAPAVLTPASATPPSFSTSYLQSPVPTYPTIARRVHVSAAGLPDQIEIRASSGHELLDAAALDAVKRWRFVPARQGDEAISRCAFAKRHA